MATWSGASWLPSVLIPRIYVYAHITTDYATRGARYETGLLEIGANKTVGVHKWQCVSVSGLAGGSTSVVCDTERERGGGGNRERGRGVGGGQREREEGGQRGWGGRERDRWTQRRRGTKTERGTHREGGGRGEGGQRERDGQRRRQMDTGTETERGCVVFVLGFDVD